MEFLVEGFLSVTWQQLIMYLIGILLIWLAIKKDYEPSLLLPMGFGAILVNLPASGVLNQVLDGTLVHKNSLLALVKGLFVNYFAAQNLLNGPLTNQHG